MFQSRSSFARINDSWGCGLMGAKEVQVIGRPFRVVDKSNVTPFSGRMMCMGRLLGIRGVGNFQSRCLGSILEPTGMIIGQSVS